MQGPRGLPGARCVDLLLSLQSSAAEQEQGSIHVSTVHCTHGHYEGSGRSRWQTSRGGEDSV